MTHEEKKVAKIVEELTLFFFAIGADRMESGISRKDNRVIITFEANYQSEYEDRIHSLEKYMNEPKNEGFEDIYWELAGSGDPGESSQLLLIGMMIDKAEIEHGENRVKLKLDKELLD